MINELITNGLRIINGAIKKSIAEDKEFNDTLFIMLFDTKGEILGSISITHNLAIIFSVSEEDATPKNCTLAEIEKVIQDAHVIKYEFTDDSNKSDEQVLEILKKIFDKK